MKAIPRKASFGAIAVKYHSFYSLEPDGFEMSLVHTHCFIHTKWTD